MHLNYYVGVPTVVVNHSIIRDMDSYKLLLYITSSRFEILILKGIKIFQHSVVLV